MTQQSHPVVVGVDGSAQSWQAVHVAAWEAAQRGLPVLLTHGYARDYPYLWYGWTPPFVAPVYDGEPPAKAGLDETANRVRAAYPEVAVDVRLSSRAGAQALIEASAGAALVVVGARGHGGFSGLSIGSVAAQTAAHAAAPVLVVRPPVPDDPAPDVTRPARPVPHPGPVVVGVDGSAESNAAIGFAFEAAAHRRVALVALHAWWALPPDNLGPTRPGHYHDTEASDEARRLTAELVAGWSGTYPDVAVELRPVASMNPSYDLIKASADAGLIVVGSRGRGGFTGLLLGSVGRDLVGHADAPVAVVHATVNP
jgi:nucleotide-binding universal stress UspA family protein